MLALAIVNDGVVTLPPEYLPLELATLIVVSTPLIVFFHKTVLAAGVAVTWHWMVTVCPYVTEYGGLRMTTDGIAVK